jgi:riboflavin kinase/FMN adenylyltransferase
MEIWQGTRGLPADGAPSVLTIGFFDGVHRGHHAVFARTVEAARESGARSVAVTFDRHPREILTPGNEPPLLTTLKRKGELIAALGPDALAVMEFTPEFARWPPEEFVERVLVKGLSASRVIVGSNFTFGHKAAGTVRTLEELGTSLGFETESVDLFRIDGRPVSSSSIREALAEGDLEWPATTLGRRYSVEGHVVTGKGRGAGLGFPTANLQAHPRLLLPGDGVYAGLARALGGEWVAAMNIGTNPTFGAEPRHLEAYLLDFSGDLRGQPFEVEFWVRLRDEERFESPEALAEQIARDVERTREIVR